MEFSTKNGKIIYRLSKGDAVKLKGKRKPLVIWNIVSVKTPEGKRFIVQLAPSVQSLDWEESMHSDYFVTQIKEVF